MDEINNVVTETEAEDFDLGGAFSSVFGDEEEPEEAVEPAEVESGEVTSEVSENAEATSPTQETDEADIESQKEEAPEAEQTPEEVETPKEETFELKHHHEVQTVNREKVIELANKGLDYDRIRVDRDSVRAENEDLKVYRDFLKELADSSKMTIEQLMDETRADIISRRDGTKKEVALSQVRAARENRKAEFSQKGLDEARRADYQRFAETHPGLDINTIPMEVWQRVNDGNLLLSEAYAPIDAENAQKAAKAKDAEIEALKSRLAALEQNEKNRERSTGSRKSASTSSAPKSTFSEAWDAWDS